MNSLVNGLRIPLPCPGQPGQSIWPWLGQPVQIPSFAFFGRSQIYLLAGLRVGNAESTLSRFAVLVG
jgi:hypothetical protein